MKQFGKILIIVGIVGLIVGFAIYLFKTEKTGVPSPLIIDKWTYYTKYGFWDGTPYYHIDELVKPTADTQPNVKYLMTIAFISFKYQNTVSWTQSEIDSNTEKTLSNVIPYPEYTALTQKPKYTIDFFKLMPAHKIIDFVPGILILLLGTAIFLRSKDETTNAKSLDIEGIPFHSQTYDNSVSEPTPEQKAKIAEALKNKKVADALATALHHMDTTHIWYTDEDEANRALVTSLKVMGYEEAVYHKYLGDGRTADAFFENSIVEGKLDPQQSEVDRLEGQITEYLKYPYAVHVVLYGHIDTQLLSRIKEIVSRKPERTFLTYLPDAKRVRKSNSA